MRGKEVSKRRAFASAVLLLAATLGVVVGIGSWRAGANTPIARNDGGNGALDVLEPGTPATAVAGQSGRGSKAEVVVKEWVATGGGSGPKSSQGK